MNFKKSITGVLATSMLVGNVFGVQNTLAKEAPAKNVLIFMVEQTPTHALGIYGNTFSQALTPNINKLASQGAVVENYYVTCPLCVPSRASVWSGLMPHQSGIEANEKYLVPDIKDEAQTFGTVLKNNNYILDHFGKGHDANTLKDFQRASWTETKFEADERWAYNVDVYGDVTVTNQVIDKIKKGAKEPFNIIVSYSAPHNIGNYIGKNIGPHSDLPVENELPPLPPNFKIDDLETRPFPVRYLSGIASRQNNVIGWSEENYRHYLNAYYHYLSILDNNIGKIMAEFEKQPYKDDTLVILTADHGEGMAEHQRVTKHTTFYDSATKVPFIAKGPGIPAGKRVDAKHLASGVDILPTICDFTGTPIPEGLWGKSIMPLLTGEQSEPLRPYVVSEWNTEWGFTITPGRMIRSENYKYMYYAGGKMGGEEFYDMKNDPYEMHNLINDKDYSAEIQKHRDYLKEYSKETNDKIFEYKPLINPEVSKYPLGYDNYKSKVASQLPLILGEQYAQALPTKGKPVKAYDSQNYIDGGNENNEKTIAKKAVDGVATDAARWISAENAVGPQYLEIDMEANYTLRGAEIYVSKSEPIKKIKMQYLENNQWIDIPGSQLPEGWNVGTTNRGLKFDKDVTTSKVRAVFDGDGYIRVMEIKLFGGLPPSNTAVSDKIKNSIILMLNNSKASVKGELKNIDLYNDATKPVVIDGRTLLPVRFISESVGAKVDWDENTSTVKVALSDKEINLKIGENTLTINGVKNTIDSYPRIIDSRTYLPVRAICEALDKNVFWDNRGLIVITEKEDNINSETDKVIIEDMINIFN